MITVHVGVLLAVLLFGCVACYYVGAKDGRSGGKVEAGKTYWRMVESMRPRDILYSRDRIADVVAIHINQFNNLYYWGGSKVTAGEMTKIVKAAFDSYLDDWAKEETAKK